MKAMPSPATPFGARHVEQRRRRAGSVVWTRWPSPGSRRFVAHGRVDDAPRRRRPARAPRLRGRPSPAAIISMQLEPAPPCSSPIARMPAAIAAESDCRLPEAASRAAAQDGAPGAVIGHADEDGVEQAPLAR